MSDLVSNFIARFKDGVVPDIAEEGKEGSNGMHLLVEWPSDEASASATTGIQRHLTKQLSMFRGSLHNEHDRKAFRRRHTVDNSCSRENLHVANRSLLKQLGEVLTAPSKSCTTKTKKKVQFADNQRFTVNFESPSTNHGAYGKKDQKIFTKEALAIARSIRHCFEGPEMSEEDIVEVLMCRRPLELPPPMLLMENGIVPEEIIGIEHLIGHKTLVRQARANTLNRSRAVRNEQKHQRECGEFNPELLAEESRKYSNFSTQAALYRASYVLGINID